MTLRILIVDEQAIARLGLRAIAEDAGMEIGGEARNGAEALHLARSQRFDAAVLDVRLPDVGGLELIRELRKLSVPVLVVSAQSEEQFAVRSIRAGAQGYLSKCCAADELVTALRRVASGRPFLSDAVIEQLAAEAQGEAPASHTLLSNREFEVLGLMVDGRAVKEIAAHLHISEKTVSTYRTRMLEKLRLGSTAGLIRYALEHGLAA
jgi:DNA-binding NarL/FixJ family response regulator